MTRLLVSVRNAQEAEAALLGGADVIDVKEPRAGSLGRAATPVVSQVLRTVGQRKPVSVALGDLPDGTAEAGKLPTGIAFAKLGLAHCAPLPDWDRQWCQILAGLPNDTSPIAVCYADWQNAAAPEPAAILDVAHGLKCSGVLLDTFDKRAPGLVQLWSLGEIVSLIGRARSQGLFVVLAGKLRAEDLTLLMPLEPDYLAVRSAACPHGRDGSIDSRAVERLKRLIDHP